MTPPRRAWSNSSALPAELARRIYNEAVALTSRLRSRRAARIFHLAGRTPMPTSCDIDDTAPQGLEQLERPAS